MFLFPVLSVTQFLIHILLFSIFGYLVNLLWNRRKLYLFSLQTRGETGLPIVGSLLDLAGETKSKTK